MKAKIKDKAKLSSWGSGRKAICISLFEDDIEMLDKLNHEFYPEISRSMIIRLAISYMLWCLEEGGAEP